MQRNKLGDTAAEELRHMILEQRLVPGTKLGSLDEVIARMHLSRGSSREALSLLQHEGVIETRPGPSGGIFVARPKPDAAIAAAINYFEFCQVRPEGVTAARLVIEPPLAGAAAVARNRRTSEDVTRSLEREAALLDRPDAFLQESQGFHVALADCVPDNPLSLFVRVLFGVAERPYRPPSEAFVIANHNAHQRIAEAVLAGEPDLAISRMRRHMQAVSSWVTTERRPPRHLAPPRPA